MLSKRSSSLVYEQSEEKTVRIEGRAPTNLGSHQGQHVSAYHLIKKAILSAETENDPVDQVKKIFHFLSNLQTNILIDIKALENNLEQADKRSQLEDIYGELEQELTEFCQRLQAIEHEVRCKKQLIAEMRTILQADTTQPPARKCLYDEILNEKLSMDAYLRLKKDATKLYLTLRNRLPDTAFPAEGNVKLISGESALIKSSFNKLNLIENTPATYSGTAKLNPQEIAQLLLNLFWYPKIPQKYFDKNGASRFTNQVSEKYKTGARPRDNNLDVLVTVVSKHIELSFLNFPNIFADEETGKTILDSFLNFIGKNGKIQKRCVGWKLEEDDFQDFLNQVSEKLKCYGVTPEEELDASFASSASSEVSMQDHLPFEHYMQQDHLNEDSDSSYVPSTESTPIKQRPMSTRSILHDLADTNLPMLSFGNLTISPLRDAGNDEKASTTLLTIEDLMETDIQPPPVMHRSNRFQ